MGGRASNKKEGGLMSRSILSRRSTPFSVGPLVGLLAVAGMVLAAPVLAAGADKPIAPGRADLKPLDLVGRWTSPKVQVQTFLQEDALNATRGDIPYRIGYPMATDLSPANSGTWENLKEGGRIWRLLVKSDQARWIVLGFDLFSLQEGASLYAYDPALQTVMGPFTARDVRDSGELWVLPIAGDSVIVELDWPVAPEGADPKLHLGTVSHGYKPFGMI